MRTFGQFPVALLCAASAALCSGQEPVPSSAATPANEAKSMVRGKVVQEPGGQGIRKARVNLTGVSAQGLAEYAGVTDEAGQSKIENVPPATYTVQVERSGYTPDPKTSPVTSIKVIAGQDTTDLVFDCYLPA